MNSIRVCVFLLFLIAVTSAGAEPVAVQIAELIGDDFNDVLVEGGYAYIAGVRGLTVVDVSDPDDPWRVSFTPLAERAYDIEYVDGVFYVATRGIGGVNGGIDMFLPFGTVPHHLGAIYGAPGCGQIQIQGNHLYAAGWRKGLKVYDVSTPSAPQLVGGLPVEGQDSLTDLLVVDGTAWLVMTYPYEDYTRTKMLKADVSDPTAPAWDYSFLWDVTVHGRLNEIDGLMHVPYFGRTPRYILPSKVFAGELPVAAHSFYPVPGGHVVDHGGGVSLLQDTAELHALDLPGSGYEGDREAGFLYRAGGRYGLQVVDVSDPSDLTLRSRYAEPQHLEAIVAADGVVYAAGRELYTIDVSDLPSPEVVHRDPVYLNDAVLDSYDHLFAVTSVGRVRSYDVSNPTQPAFLFEEMGGEAEAIVERDRRLYVADDDFGLRILDASDPASGLPEIYQGVETRARKIALGPRHAYVCNYDDCLIYDITNPAAPQLVGQFPLTNTTDDILIAYEHLFLLGNRFGVEVYSLADPASPVLVPADFGAAFERARTMDRDGVHLVVVDDRTIRLFDVRNPAAPVEVVTATRELPVSIADGVDLDGNIIHLATGSGYSSWRLDSVVSAPAGVRSSLVVGSYPNPARGATQFYFETPVNGPVHLKLYDVAGRLVRGWVAEAVPATRTEIFWDGTDHRGRKVSSGAYFLRAQAGGVQSHHRLVWMK